MKESLWRASSLAGWQAAQPQAWFQEFAAAWFLGSLVTAERAEQAGPRRDLLADGREASSYSALADLEAFPARSR